MKKILLFLLIGMFMLSFTSALDFDNVKSEKTLTFDGESIKDNKLLEMYKPIEITNKFGLGKTLFEGYLSQHDYVCGIDCKSTMKIKLHQDGVLVDDVIFKTLQEDNSWIEQDVRSYQFQYLKNNVWINYQIGDKVKAGVYELKLEANRKPSRTVDWIIKTNGEWLNSWAVWTPTEHVYDEINDSSINASIWTTSSANSYNPANSFIVENTEYLKCYVDNHGEDGSYTDYAQAVLNDSMLPSLSGIRNFIISFNDGYSGGDCDGDLTVNRIYKFGSNTLSGTGIFEFKKNYTSTNLWDVYDDGNYQNTVSFSGGDIFTIRTEMVCGGGACGACARGSRAYYIYYNYSQGYIILNSPTDSYTSPISLVTFNASASVVGGATLVNMSLWTNETGSWAVRNTTNSYDYDSGEYSSASTAYPPTNLVKTINIDNKEITKATGWLKSSVVGTQAFQRILFNYTDGTSNYSSTQSTSSPNNVYQLETYTNPNPTKIVNAILIYLSGNAGGVIGYTKNHTTFQTIDTQTLIRSYSSGSNILWSYQACDSDGDCGFATSNYTLSIDSNAPTISVESPSGLLDYGGVGISETLNVTFTDSNLDSCWYNYNGTNVTISGCQTGIKNSTSFTLEYANTNMTLYANDNIGNLNSTFINWSYKIMQNNFTHNSTSYESKAEKFIINLTANSSLSSVKLVYNTTEYTPTQSGDIYTVSLDVPLGVTNNSLRWKFTYAGETLYSDYYYQDVGLLNFSLCDGSLTNDFLNISFKDEATLNYINASIPSSTFIYYLGSGSINKTYTFYNTSNNYYYDFCATPTTETLNLKPYIQYKQGTDYPQRIWQSEVVSLTSSVTNAILYLLNSLDAIDVTFQLINTAEQAISGVDITASRTLGGSPTIISQGTTDAAGSVTFWLNPDFQHTLSFSKSGYDEYSTTLTPTQTIYTVTLGTEATSSVNYLRGIVYSINPSATFLDDNGLHNFNYTISSTHWNLDEFNMTLSYENGTVVSSQSSTSSTGGTLNYDINLSLTDSVTMNYFYVIDGNTTSGIRVWQIQNTVYRPYSIRNFVDKFVIMIDGGLFGIDNFGRVLISFLIILFVIGGLSTRYGIASEAVLLGFLFGIVFLLDFGLGFIPQISVGSFTANEHFLTYVTFLIVAGKLFMEEMR